MKLFLVSALIAAVSARIQFTSPVTGTKWDGNKDVTITWLAPEQADQTSSLTIDLVDGPESNLKLVQNIASNVKGSDLKYTFKVPDTLPSKADYSVKVTVKKTDGTSDMNFSGRFQIATTGASAPKDSATVENGTNNNSTSGNTTTTNTNITGANNGEIKSASFVTLGAASVLAGVIATLF